MEVTDRWFKKNSYTAGFTITSVISTASDALSTFLRPHPQKNMSYPLKNAQNRAGDFWLCESLCTGPTDGGFQAGISV